MRVIRFFVKIALLPVILIVTLMQWFFIFLIGFSSIVFNVLAGLSVLIAVLSYLMEISSGEEAIGMVVTGFVIFMVPVIGERLVILIAATNTGLREYIRF